MPTFASPPPKQHCVLAPIGRGFFLSQRSAKSLSLPGPPVAWAPTHQLAAMLVALGFLALALLACAVNLVDKRTSAGQRALRRACGGSRGIDLRGVTNIVGDGPEKTSKDCSWARYKPVPTWTAR
ncbi:hypothetical protein DFP73DRAFT_595171 [Morchella snyderi]|nr:hypothetical protein DFP73DRAFT_595171 [Morchella snyderi]